MTIDTIQQEIIDEFAFFDDWADKYRYLIDLGETLPPFAENKKDDDHRIFGCQSMVWFDMAKNDDTIAFTATSDSAIVRGLIALVIRVYSGQSAKDILETPPYFADKIGLGNHLSPTRKNGLSAMLNHITQFAANHLSTG